MNGGRHEDMGLQGSPFDRPRVNDTCSELPKRPILSDPDFLLRFGAESALLAVNPRLREQRKAGKPASRRERDPVQVGGGNGLRGENAQ